MRTLLSRGLGRGDGVFAFLACALVSRIFVGGCKASFELVATAKVVYWRSLGVRIVVPLQGIVGCYRISQGVRTRPMPDIRDLQSIDAALDVSFPSLPTALPPNLSPLVD